MSIGPLDHEAPRRNLTPVMARLDPSDVEVLDALITAGIVPNRAEGVRWALNRIRERPAYTQLREHIGKIGELKAQL
jgi:Arc/MetJ-type ribon-helix-helix transcriptional regulator